MPNSGFCNCLLQFAFFLAIPAMVTCGFSLSLCLCNPWWVPAMQLGSQLSNGQWLASMALAPWQQTNPTWKVFGHQPNMESQWNPTGWLPQSCQVLPWYGLFFSWCLASLHQTILGLLGDLVVLLNILGSFHSWLGSNLAIPCSWTNWGSWAACHHIPIGKWISWWHWTSRIFGLGALQPGLQQWSLVCPLGTWFGSGRWCPPWLAATCWFPWVGKSSLKKILGQCMPTETCGKRCGQNMAFVGCHMSWGLCPKQAFLLWQAFACSSKRRNHFWQFAKQRYFWGNNFSIHEGKNKFF